MKFIVYYILAVGANIVSFFVFSNYINISVMSIIPLILIVLAVFQSVYFNKQSENNDFNTAYGSGFTENEQAQLSKYTSKTLLLVIPFIVPFIFYFTSGLKLITILFYVLSLIIGPVVYRIKNKDDLNRRINKQKKELEEQKKREEMGDWK